MQQRIIFHVDVNSAFLSWEAAYRKSIGDGQSDLRNIPSIVGGDVAKRKGIVLAKSVPAKKYGITTGCTVAHAKMLCPNLTIVSPSYDLYAKASRFFVALLKEYSPLVEQYSIDECFIDMSGALHGDCAHKVADEIRSRIFNELGFSVNVGVSNNKLLAKMASEFEKPNFTHTLFPNEIEEKMWPLDVTEMFMVGRRTGIQLKNMGINTIGELAHTNPDILLSHFKTVRGTMLHNYANGIDTSSVRSITPRAKSVSNSTTIAYDITDKKEAHLVIVSLSETVGKRLREKGLQGKTIGMYYKNSDFISYGRSRKYDLATQCTKDIYTAAIALFDEIYNGAAIRAIGVYVSDLSEYDARQLSFFDTDNRYHIIDNVMDKIRRDYGNAIITRGGFIESGIKAMSGGIGNVEHYPGMKSYL